MSPRWPDVALVPSKDVHVGPSTHSGARLRQWQAPRMDTQEAWACRCVGLKFKDGRQLSVSDGETRGPECERQYIIVYGYPDHLILYRSGNLTPSVFLS